MRARARRTFAAKCGGCHSAAGDLHGIATRISDPKALQNAWVAGGGRGGRGAAAVPNARTVMVTVTESSGEKTEGRLVRIDDFLVTVGFDDGTQRTFRRDGDTPKVDVRDPMKGHRDLLAVYTDKDIHDVTAYLVTLEMTLKKLLLTALLLAPAILIGQSQGVNPAELLKPLKDSWPTYNGDYSGKRYSALTQINQSNVKNLTLAWMTRVTAGLGTGAARGATIIVGGEGPGDFAAGGGSIKGSVLQVDGILYVTMPDNAWAIDARDGRELWHYFWKTRGGTHIANRGAAIWNNFLFFETPDNYLVSLDARTGKERWHKEIADLAQQYFSTPAPIVIGNHVLVGTGNDIDSPGFLQSFDPETGELQWKFYTVPMKPGDPGADTWKSLDAARHGGAQTWIPGAYDPETKLYIFGTGNPTPAYTTGTRGEGDNLFTCSLIAVNVDTGKMAWYFQTSPHDMHDYDSAQTPVLVDGMFNGRMRKLVLTAARNGYYFTLDRVTGERLVTSKYGSATNWASGLNKFGGPQRDPGEGSDGARVAGVADCRRHHQLAAARLLSGHRSVLCSGAQRVLALLSDRCGPAGIDGPWRARGGQRRIGRELPDGDRLQDGESRLETSLFGQRRRRRRIADDGGRAAVCRRRRGQPGGA